jgi:predicted nucleic acid-binding protein
MPTHRLFLDASFVVAMIDRRDQFHRRARGLRPLLDSAETITTEAVLIEVANALSRWNRAAASDFIGRSLQAPSFQVIGVDAAPLLRGLTLYRSHADKTWGLTDCISFVVMRDQSLTDVLTADRHFVQAGFRALMLEEP